MEKTIREMFQNIIENNVYNEQMINKYFSPDYEQIVDDKYLKIEEFITHIKKLKEVVETAEVSIINFATQDNSIFTKHIVKTVLKDGSKHTHKVFAEFIINDNKIIRCEELTLMIAGSEVAKRLGSMT
ncbi:hypothetical protein [Myroides injenensis]|uniref:hypothetical protein n=1 Tax=Myroides injenensis TaxID=1183151 RepID=UPI000289EAFD|nr:hypothetical protein [Myroides injenensis]